ncbi:MAG: heme-binding protein [Gammaproteobacteria bacterium]|nr:heme-binding protein [Gammaproteobacteria bacterium]
MSNESTQTPATPLPYGMPISLHQARLVMQAAEEEATRHHWPMVIAIVDSAGHLVMLHRMDQAQHGSIRLAQQKAETAINFRRSSKAFQDLLASAGEGLRVLSMEGVSAVEGGELLMSEGKIIGAIGVSGMLPVEDTQVAQAGVEAVVLVQ